MNGQEHSLRLLTAKELSQATGLPLSTIYKFVEAEQIPFLRLKNKRQRVRVYFRPAEISAWLDGKSHIPIEVPDRRI